MRILIRRIHLIVSVVAGAWLAIAGAAGAVLVWGDAIDRAIHPELFRIARPAERVPLERVLETAAAVAGAPLLRVRLAGSATPVHEVWAGCEYCLRVWVDPSTGDVNGVRRATGTVRGFLHELHRRMLSGKRGEKFVGVGGIVLATLAVTGIVLWWPRGRWRGALAIRAARGWKLLNHDLHRTFGFFLAPFLLVSALTGTYFVFHAPVDRFVAWLAGPPRAGAITSPAGTPPSTLDSFIRRASSRFPGSEATWLTPATGEAFEVVVRLRQSAEAHPNGRTFVRFDARTGAIAGVTDALASHPARKVLDNLYPLHIGRLGGLPHRIALTFVGLAPSFFFATGLLMWWNRSLRRRVRNAFAPKAERELPMKLIVIAVFALTLPACVSSSFPPDAAARPATDVPSVFLGRDGADLRPARAVDPCRDVMVDPRDRTDVTLVRSQAGRGDYAVPPGRYGVEANELLRLDCRTGEVIGIVAGER